MKMNRLFNLMWEKEMYHPTYVLGIWINPFFIIRRALRAGIQEMAFELRGGSLLDVGCGRKPYEKLFEVDSYVGVDIIVSGHDHSTSKVDVFYDGVSLPFSNDSFQNVFSSEVFEHVFNIDDLLGEIYRVLEPGGKLGFTCPFVWDEHEQPYDFARYTSYGIEHLLSSSGFTDIKIIKSTSYFETIIQMLTAYIFQHVLPNNKYFKALLTPILIAPINLTGMALAMIVPKSYNFYHNNIVTAEKAPVSLAE